MSGTWSRGDVTLDTQRPGLFANFLAQATTAIKGGLSGTVGAVIAAPWGPDEEVTTVSDIGTIKTLFREVDTGVFTGWFTLSNIL